jgi:zinc protease
MVSAQMFYKSGSRDETAGKTGLAHFLEHLAFRASARFPNGAATEAIYDSGGEWHGYTWLDQTTYFSTMPPGGLDLLLGIEADRMANVAIDPASMDAEKGAVITEMHGYENDPASVLLDAVAAAAFVSHPYRNNTIGLESDVAALTIEDARDFYRRHYSPANAVLAVAGDFRPVEAKALIERHFAKLATRAAPPRIKAIEPPQRGVRRVDLLGPVDRQHFEIAWPAPAASSTDFPAFLVLQQLLSGGSGVNFDQNDWGTPSVEGSRLHGVTEDLRSWFIPTADRYMFTVKGSIAHGASREQLEQTIEQRLASIRTSPPSASRLAEAKAAVAQQLVADVGSTEDAAHQLAFFEGLGALDMLVNLNERIAAVSPGDVHRLAQAYLAPELRTIGWYRPGRPPPVTALGAGAQRSAAERPGSEPRTSPAPAPDLRRLSGGLPVIVRANPSAHAVTVKLLVTGPVGEEEAPRALPGLGIVTRSGPPEDLGGLLTSAQRPLAVELLSRRRTVEPPSDDPETRLQQMIAAEMRITPAAELRPLALAISGAVDPAAAYRLAEQRFGPLRPGTIARDEAVSLATPPNRTSVRIAKPLSQGALGYVAEAPAPGTREGLAWRMLLYILTHDYSGRLGRSAINDKGLAYHIYSAYRTDGRRGWVTIWTGVDPAKADALEAEFRAQLARLASNPPTAAEIAAARQHLLGRDLSGAQTNDEIAGKLLRNFVETGGLRSHAELKAALEAVGPADVAAAARGFNRGTMLRVDVGAD